MLGFVDNPLKEVPFDPMFAKAFLSSGDVEIYCQFQEDHVTFLPQFINVIDGIN